MRRVFRIPFGRGQISREVDDELAFHLEMRVQQLVATGLSPDAARAEALRQFGSLSTVKEECVAMDERRTLAEHRASTIGELRQNVVFALRTLRHNAGFTALIVGALAVGIGANTSIFTLIEAVLMRTLPVSHAEQLVAIGDPGRVNSLSQGGPRTDLLSYPLYKDLRDRNRVFRGVVASGRSGRLDVRIDGNELEHPRGRLVTANYFSVLGVPAAAGRIFNGTEDDNANGSPVAIISYGYWTRRFHEDRSAIGRRVVVDDVPITIIGVAAPEFTGDVVGTAVDMWLPVTMTDAMHPHQRMLNDPVSSWLLALGRLVPGATLAQAQGEITTVITQSVVAASPGNTGQAFLASKPKMFIQGGAKGFSRVRLTFQTPLVTLMIGVGLLLCIICANIATLLLARAIARGREMSVRLALGASRARLVRQLLTEHFVIGAIGGIAGVLLAWWGRRVVLALVSGGLPVSLSLGLDGRVLVFTLLVSFIAVVLFGLVPALRASRVDLASTMRAGATSVAGGTLGRRGQRAPLGKMLIAGQVALSIVLLVGAAMLVRSLRNIENVDAGLDRDHLVIVDLDVNSRGYTGPRLIEIAHRLRDRLSAVPGVAAVAFSENGIFSGEDSEMAIEVPGFIARTANDSSIYYDLVGPGYVNAIGGRVLQGRELSATDEGRPPHTAIVNRAFADFYFPGVSAAGKFVHVSDTVAIQIVGVIGDVRDHTLDGTATRRMYFAYAHSDTATSAAVGPSANLRLEVRAAGDPSSIVQAVRQAIVQIDPLLPIDGIDPLTTLMRATLRAERLVASLATVFGVLALALAAVGLYGVMTYAITRRTAEIGLRVALGARRVDVVRLVLIDAFRLVGIGLVVGVPLALGATRLLGSQLHGIGAIDPVSIAGAISVLATSAALAVVLPALRASRVSPIVAIRAE